MTADSDNEYPLGFSSGRAWAEASDDLEAVENVESFTYDAGTSFDELLALYQSTSGHLSLVRSVAPESGLSAAKACASSTAMRRQAVSSRS